ncbi:MAG: hypothetical protein Q4G39_01555 [Brachymonas sp.]|nr:hypothetical protein [Brachymonas sp.]
MPQPAPPQQPNLSVLRRQNLLALLQEFAENMVSAGAVTKGIEQAFAEKIQVSPSMLSQMKAGRPIGNKIARQIEVLCKRPAGWLDTQHPDQKPSPAEEAFVTLAREVWRSQNAKGKRELQQYVQSRMAKP